MSENIAKKHCQINGVIIFSLNKNCDYRGNFTEILRQDWGVMDKISQISYSRTHPQIIKAFHMHSKQNEAWHVARGDARVVLYDKRENSESFGKLFEISLGESSSVTTIFIPAGVAHGYQVLGNKDLEVIYMADKVYDYENPDELRFSYDDKEINFDWSLKNR